MDDQTARQTLENVQRAIAAADLAEIAKAIPFLDAAKRYAHRKAKSDRYAHAKRWASIAREADIWSLEARWVAGGQLKEMPKNPGALLRGSKLEPREDIPTLADLGITKVEAHRWVALTRWYPDREKWGVFKNAVRLGETEASVLSAMRFAAEHFGPIGPSKPMPQPPTGTYRCIVIDPPWPVAKIQRDKWPAGDQGGLLDYDTMDMDEIQGLPIPSLAAEDGCHVYLWTTHKYLPKAFDLFLWWGVAYECLLTWLKPEGMVPYSFMYNTEHALFGRIGHLPVQQYGIKIGFQAAQRGTAARHSRKPDAFYEIVRAASPEPRIDLFAREAHEGFEAWGKEVQAQAQNSILEGRA